MSSLQIIYDVHAAIKSADIEALYNCFHKKNGTVEAMKKQYEMVFKEFKLDTQLLSCQKIGEDEVNIVIKDQVKTSKLSGPTFKDNITTNIYVLERESNNEWKILSSNLIDITYL